MRHSKRSKRFSKRRLRHHVIYVAYKGIKKPSEVSKTYIFTSDGFLYIRLENCLDDTKNSENTPKNNSVQKC